MKKLFDWIAERTPQYKHLKDLYEQALRDCVELQYDIQENNINIDFYKNSFENTQKAYTELEDLFDKLNNNTKEANKYYTKLFKKIRARVNKLDKKDKNVKEIKRLIKEIL